MARRVNPNRVKIHYSYTVEEVAGLLGKHKNTIREWIKKGLPICDDKRPILILGFALREFIRQQNKSQKRPCKANQIYCMRCRSQKVPVNQQVKFVIDKGTSGRLIGVCPNCSGLMHRFTNTRKLDAIKRVFTIVMPSA